MEDKLVQILERFEEAFVEFTKGKDAFSLKSDYIEFKYAAVDTSFFCKILGI